MSRSGLDAFAGRILRALVENDTLFHVLRLPAYWGTLPHLVRAVDAGAGERLLDIGCGTGLGMSLTRGTYVGIDTELRYLRMARRRAPGPRCSFLWMSAVDLGFRDGVFDKAVLINMVHHLEEADVDRLLLQLSRVVRGRVVVLDAAPDIANRVGRFILAHDRGRYVRRLADLRALLARRYVIEREEVFYNATRTVRQVLFTLAPLGSSRACE